MSSPIQFVLELPAGLCGLLTASYEQFALFNGLA